MGFLAVWCLRPCPKGVVQAGRPGNACHRLRPGHAVGSVSGQWGKKTSFSAEKYDAGRLPVSSDAIAGHGGNGGNGGPRALHPSAGLLTALHLHAQMNFWPMNPFEQHSPIV